MYSDQVCLDGDSNCAKIDFCGLTQLAGPSILQSYSGVLGLNAQKFSNGADTYSFVDEWAIENNQNATVTFSYAWNTDGDAIFGAFSMESFDYVGGV